MGLGKSKQVFSTGFFMLLLIHASGQETRNFSYQINDGIKTGHLIADDGSIIIDYHIPELNLESVSNDHGSFFRVSVPGHNISDVPGDPELPVYSKLITIPEGSHYTIHISNVKSRKIDPRAKQFRGVLYPVQESQPKQVQRKPEFRMNGKAYSQKSLLKTDTVRIIPLGRIRNNNLANLYISPVRYNPRSNILEVITSMKIEILFTPKGSTGIISAARNSAAFNATLSKGILNYTRELVEGYSEKPASMIILTDTAFRKALEPYLVWKTQKGFRLHVLYRGSDFAGTTYAELKDTIKTIYNSYSGDEAAPDYLLIVGDVNKIPYYQPGSYKTDLYYGEFDGNGDYLPEIYVGRLPVRDTTDVKSVIAKLLQYEKYDFKPENTFDERVIATTGRDFEHATYMDGQVRYLVNNYFTPENNIEEYHFYHNEISDLTAHKDSVIDLINMGTSLINYTGHGDPGGWLHLNIRVADTARMHNKNMYPLIVSNACETAAWFNAASFGNNMLLVREKGAMGVIGCSYPSYWNEDYYWAVGMGTITDNPVYANKGYGSFDRLFHTHDEYPSEWYYTIGQMNYAGNLAVSSSTSGLKKRYWETYNVTGDPSIIPIIGKPRQPDIQLPDTLPNGITTLTLTSDPFAYAAVSHFDTLWDASYCSPSGSVTLGLPGISDDSCLVVITAQNRYPVIKKIYISQIEREFLNLDSARISDPAGNNNQRADYGENLFLNVSLTNLGLSGASDSRLILKSMSPWLTVMNDSVQIGNFPGQTSLTISGELSVKVAGIVTDMAIATLDLAVKTAGSVKHYRVDVSVHSPELKITGCLINDAATGNGDLVADPGEKFNLVLRVSNEGTADASGDITLSSVSPDIVIHNGTKSGIFKYGELTDIPIEVELSSGVPSGGFIPVSTILDCSPYSVSKDFEFRIGKMRESFEMASFDVFPWMNFSPVPWIITSSTGYEGSFSARSGPISHNGRSVLRIRMFYSEDDTLSFHYKVSSEAGYDLFLFRLNGAELLKKSGDIPWNVASIPIEAGYNELEWEFSMDKSNLFGENCAWIDQIDFAKNSTIRYIQKDLHASSIISPNLKERYGKENLVVSVRNTGKDVINGFYLAYMVNGLGKEKQFFGNTIYPNGDSVIVSFNSRVDFSDYGVYKITVFVDDEKDEFADNDTTSKTIEHRYIHETLNVYPNPFRESFDMLVNSQSSFRATVSIWNSKGSCIYTRQENIIRGNNKISINDARLPAGVYYLNVKGGTFNKIVPIISIVK